jgi:hypothetical protein
MHYLIKKLDNLSDYRFLRSLVEGLVENRPNKKKRKWVEKRIINQDILEIFDLFSINRFHVDFNKINEEKIKKIEIKRWDGKDYRVLVDCSIRCDDECVINEYKNGILYSVCKYKRKFVSNDDTYEVLYTMFGGYEIIELFDLGKRTNLIVSHFGSVKLFIEFSYNKNNVCYQCFPVSETEEGNVSWNFITLMLVLCLLIVGMFWYFQSIPIVGLIIGLSFSVLSMSESINPKQRSVFRVIQIIIYGIVMVFLR